ncbi:MAG: hypothetical protein FWC27_15430 [Firmicutes bacterium]|nr:hypothetical protein [Bacillota bacterium]
MTNKELSQLYHLNREITEQQRRLAELESLSTSCTSRITGLPASKNLADKVADYAIEMAELRTLIDLNLKKCFYELNRLTRYINCVDDSLMRQILSLRHINGLSWVQIAFSLGGDNTADGVRMAHKRFLEKN